MITLSKQRDDIEQEYFFLFELGIAWELEEFSVIYFSGLHCHGGNQPMYKGTPKEPYWRLTLIAYPQGDILDGLDKVAFASLPTAPKQVLPIPTDLRDPTKYVH
jgi:hypothetical protein